MDRRASRRIWCAELVEVRWKDKEGKLQRSTANLEDISRTGVCVMMEGDVPIDTAVVVCCEGVELPGAVRYCAYRDSSYFLGVEFAEGTRWSRLRFQPQHMLDPRELVNRATGRSRTDIQ
jgi:hypothetical protein